MRPTLLQFGDITVPSFFFLMMLGALLAIFYGQHVANKEKADSVCMFDIGIISILAALIGGRLLHVFVEYPAYYFENPVRVLYFWQGGFASIGSFILTPLAWIVYLKRRKHDVPRYFDIATLVTPIVLLGVRTGCLMVGCCYGKPTDFFLHLIFSHPASTAARFHPGVALHATQAYFMLSAVLAFILLSVVYRKRKFYGQVSAVFLIYYGFARFFIEFLRGDADRGMFFNGTVSVGQIAMFFSVAIGVTIWVYCRTRKPIVK